ncbi:hypothetical protein Rin_00011240 [Candidatus Regiella insecticola 5.15]|uniref:Uncharacterized protein n=1 Tax=Candidatus Regiella insecticola 5.15 TaxID=1005043 RepID=G2GZA9_9ENTR|nr:hypothetical protein [Candidatus Regiella insecticola]EGY28921.1 hypothetical protein Rin_00011240 [Candidatus Regiella insecticola 5.15]
MSTRTYDASQLQTYLHINTLSTELFAFEVAFGCQGDRPMSVDILPDSANTCSQQLGGFKGEGYKYH